MSQTLFKNGKIVKAAGIFREDLLIENGKVFSTGVNLPENPEYTIVDCSGKLIFPGIIDPHTHMGIPIKNLTSRDNFESGTLAAVHGGVTTIIDFSILESNQTLKDSINTRKKAAEISYTDFGLHCNFTRMSDDLLNEIPDLAKDGIVSFKVFTTYREAGMMLEYAEIKKVAEQLAKENCVLMVHSEDDTVIKKASKTYLENPPSNPKFHGLSRPAASEAAAIEKIGEIAAASGCEVYIVHLSSEAGLMAAQSSQGLLLETCPQYLLLEENVYQRADGRMYVASPPLRRTSDNHALWRGLLMGSINTIGTDHCPFCVADKPDDLAFNLIPNGMGGIETSFPIMLAQFIRQDLPLNILSAAMSEAPSKIFGLFPAKGHLSPGADGDLVIVDPEKISMNWSGQQVSKIDWNGFLEYPAIFPDEVYLRGNKMVENGNVIGKPEGRFVPGVK